MNALSTIRITDSMLFEDKQREYAIVGACAFITLTSVFAVCVHHSSALFDIAGALSLLAGLLVLQDVIFALLIGRTGSGRTPITDSYEDIRLFIREQKFKFKRISNGNNPFYARPSNRLGMTWDIFNKEGYLVATATWDIFSGKMSIAGFIGKQRLSFWHRLQLT